MPFRSTGRIRYYYFESLDAAGIPHGIFTRRGGESPAPWSSLNVGLLVGDDLARVAENTGQALSALGGHPEAIRTVRQVHGRDVVVVGGGAAGPQPPEADGMVTDQKGIMLAMRFADCVPVLIADPRRRVVGIAHAGWRGSVAKIAARAVRALVDSYGTNPADLLAGIGPAICAEHYEIGPEVAVQVEDAFGADSRQLLSTRNGSRYFDLWQANRLTLEQTGVQEIEMAKICTADRLDDWFSHRAENGRTGRFLALVGIPRG